MNVDIKIKQKANFLRGNINNKAFYHDTKTRAVD